MQKLEKLAGVWMDHHEAHIISNHDGQEVTSMQIKGHVKADENHRYGSEVTAHNSKVTNLHKFFHEIMEHLTNTQKLHLLGTGTAQEEFTHYLANIPQWQKLKVSDEPTGKMNAEQTLNKIAEHYSHQL